MPDVPQRAAARPTTPRWRPTAVLVSWLVVLSTPLSADLRIVPRGLGGAALPAGLDPGQVTAHLVPDHDPEVELVFPADRPLRPPPGRYRVWLQGLWSMTPYSLVLAHSETAGTEVDLPLGPAGKVQVAEQLRGDPDLVLHLLAADGYRENGRLRWELSVRRPVTEVGDGVLMPAGRILAGLWQRREGRYVALSHPFPLRAATTVEAPLRAPDHDAFLLAQISKGESPDDAPSPSLWVELEGESIQADLVIDLVDRQYGAWYGLAARPGELRADSPDWYVRQAIPLSPGGIWATADVLRAKASLEVELRLPRAFPHASTSLELRERPTGQVVASLPVLASDHRKRFPAIVPGAFELVLDSPLGSWSQPVELAEGQAGFEVVEPPLLTLYGTVFRGEEPHPATLTWTTAGQTTHETLADAGGAYEIALLQPPRSVSIQLEGRSTPPFVEYIFNRGRESPRQLDFRIPDSSHRARVVDARSGRGIAEAQVAVRNTFTVEPTEPSQKPQGRAVSQQVTTDDRGVAELPPLRPGSIVLRATANGYRDSKEPVRATIGEDPAEQDFVIRLEPWGETVPLRLRLPTGEPAVGAEVLLLDAPHTGADLFSGRSDAEGQVGVPVGLSGLLLARHNAAGFLVRPWAPAFEDEITWSLPAPAGRPLRLRIVDPSGEAGVAGATISLLVDGHWLTGKQLAFLTRARPRVDPQGFWVAQGLPAAPVSVMAWARSASPTQPPESWSVALAFPWPDLVEVPLAQ